MLKRVESFLSGKLPAALTVRDQRAAALLELDEVVVAAVAALKERGFVSPYLKAFVIARINPLRFQRGGEPKFDETVEKMLASARKFDAAKIKPDQVAAASGLPRIRRRRCIEERGPSPFRSLSPPRPWAMPERGSRGGSTIRAGCRRRRSST